ncbi:MAG: tryptophan--tRNA ligase [Candidatus Omnitrophica bacterium CG1_02_44_16]|nr:MAG: tryptophan--tRNA ligase [Candidatus Omnitrophica bacterium CG1_02_44_16]PIY84000.1 MAG: tryptophan--tRNA ligase [Candidatus Omnitrophica bacterium CG_4_10_14_0_8_um_filter_44_12]PIZ84774.1 MAG: tryptophan--tRNA ligase [Candidatus Omnitrophica bacterium CG_4_10_14_0_2_um_filter_44_9]
MSKQRILSGMRPTGKLHLGHLVGALNNWARLQSEYECFFMAADWHALMSEYENSKIIEDSLYDNVADWLASGIDPGKSTIFIQSQIPAHLELYMVFSALTPLGWLERCPTYKEQMKELKDRHISTYAFLGYPVLQAADICLYKAHVVPVGEDQLPHLELTREIVRKFNGLYKEIFPEPRPLLTPVPRLLGLDGRKMSKSYNNFIALSDAQDVIKKKTQGMFTDPKRIRKTDPGHPDTCNVHSYFEIFAPELKDKVASWCSKAEVGCTECKSILGEELVKFLGPFQEKRRHYLEDKKKLACILEAGRARAEKVAAVTMKEVREVLRLTPCPTR